jgi:DNA-binding NarL/FixJ family response regulator
MRVLFADDHVMMREALRPHLEGIAEKVEVVEAGSAPDVMRRLDGGETFDLIIIDLKMPGMNGLEGLREMRDRHPGKRFVVLSSSAEPETIGEAMRLGVAGYIPKQMSTAQMRVALQLVLTGERFIPAAVMAGGKPGLPGEGVQGVSLTAREQDILPLLREGLPNKVIAQRLGVGEVTIKTHVSNLLRKLKVKNRAQAIRRLHS